MGDSLLGANGNPCLTTPMVKAVLGTQALVTNLATGGNTLLNMIGQIPTLLAPLLSTTPGVQNVCLWDGAANDAVGGASTATIESRIHTFGTSVQAIGFTSARVSVQSSNLWTIYGVDYPALVTWERANWPTYATGFSDNAANPFLGPPTAYANLKYFIDNTHNTQNGSMVAAQQCILPMLTALLGPP